MSAQSVCSKGSFRSPVQVGGKYFWSAAERTGRDDTVCLLKGGKGGWMWDISGCGAKVFPSATIGTPVRCKLFQIGGKYMCTVRVPVTDSAALG